MKTLTAFFLILTHLVSPQVFAAAGNEGAHGGDTYALEFTAIGKALADQLARFETRDSRLFRKWNFTAEEFRRAVLGARDLRPVRVVSQERVYLRSQEVEAINVPADRMIQLSRTAWRQGQLHERVRLTFHEYLGILQVEQDRYDASIDFADFLVSVTQELSRQSAEDSFMGNYYYGYIRSYPALSEIEVCDPSAKRVITATEAARSQAKALCAIGNSLKCEVLETRLSEVLSTEMIGMKYCEILVLMK